MKLVSIITIFYVYYLVVVIGDEISRSLRLTVFEIDVGHDTNIVRFCGKYNLLCVAFQYNLIHCFDTRCLDEIIYDYRFAIKSRLFVVPINALEETSSISERLGLLYWFTNIFRTSDSTVTFVLAILDPSDGSDWVLKLPESTVFVDIGSFPNQIFSIANITTLRESAYMPTSILYTRHWSDIFSNNGNILKLQQRTTQSKELVELKILLPIGVPYMNHVIEQQKYVPPLRSSSRHMICGFHGRFQYNETTLVSSERSELLASVYSTPDYPCSVHVSLGSKYVDTLPEYIAEMASKVFVLCPSSVFHKETFRFFESLELGTIPIITRTNVDRIVSPFHDSFDDDIDVDLSLLSRRVFLEDYPGPLLSQWSDITQFTAIINELLMTTQNDPRFHELVTDLEHFNLNWKITNRYCKDIISIAEMRAFDIVVNCWQGHMRAYYAEYKENLSIQLEKWLFPIAD